MKSINIYRFIIFLAAVAVSCKKDLGNYNYHVEPTPVIDTTGMGATYNVPQFGTLNITPKINNEGDTTQLSYQWLSYVVTPGGNGTNPAVEVGTYRNFNGTVNIRPGTYYLELIVTNKVTRMKSNARFTLNVMPYIETGWLVLHSKDGQSDVDLIVTKNILRSALEEKRMKNLYEFTYGSKIPGTGKMIAYSRRSNSDFNWVTIGTDRTMLRLNGFTFAQLAKDAQFFRRAEGSINPQAMMQNSDHEGLINNGQLHVNQWSSPLDAVFSGAYRGDYSLAPYFVYNNFSPMGLWVYDQKNTRFLYTTSTLANLNFQDCKPPAEADQPFNLSNTGKELLYMERGMSNYLYAFMKDKTGTGRDLYVVNATKSSDDGKMAFAAYNMNTLPDINNAKFFTVGDLGNFALYATDKAIYRYDYSGSGQAIVNFSGIGPNETITGMKIFKSTLNINTNTADFTLTNNSVLFVATWDGTQGRVYELSMSVVTGLVEATPLRVYDGFGRIMDMAFKWRGTGA